jgi:hypothetical protein
VYYYELIDPIVYELLRPKLGYNSQNKRYEGHFAALLITQYPMFSGGNVDSLTAWFHKMVQAKVAGGVVARKLLPSCDGGDVGDKLEYEKFCADLQKQYPGLQIDLESCWQCARATVEEQIDTDPRIIESIQQKAIELRNAFGLVD